MKSLRTMGFVAVVLGLLFFAGCVNERDSGDSKIFTVQLWVPFLIFVVGMVAAPAGWFLREWSDRFAWGLMIVGPIAALGFAPSIFLDKTVVSPSEITVRSGIWGMTGNHHVKYDNIQNVRLTTEVSRGRRGRKNYNHYMVCECKDGTTCKLPLSNDCVEKAAPHFLGHCQAKGITITDELGIAE